MLVKGSIIYSDRLLKAAERAEEKWILKTARIFSYRKAKKATL